MKKNMVRILAFVLVLILALGIIPLGAFAAGSDNAAWVYSDYYAQFKPTFADPAINAQYNSSGERTDPYGTKYSAGQTVKVSDYSGSRVLDGQLYDFLGFIDYNDYFSKWATFNKANEHLLDSSYNPTPEWEQKAAAFMKDTYYAYTKSDIKIDPYPDATKYPGGETSEAYLKAVNAWNQKYGFGSISANYAPHQHSLSYWYADNTTHWRECLVCKRFSAQGFWEPFMFQNWHSDGDEDRVCDVCGHDIPYHEINVEEVKGGKITVELDEAPHRKKIVATAEPEEGYKLKKIHFIKVRDNGTEQEITRRKTSTKGTWWTYMPTYDLKVTAEFVKKK